MDYALFEMASKPFQASAEPSHITSAYEIERAYTLYLNEIFQTLEPVVNMPLDDQFHESYARAIADTFRILGNELPPLLDVEAVEAWITDIEDEVRAEPTVAIACLAAILFETAVVKVPESEAFSHLRRELNLDIWVASYASWKAAQEFVKTPLSETWNVGIRDGVATLINRISNAENKINALYSHAAERIQAAQDKTENFATQTLANEQNLEAFKLAALEALKINTAKRLWKQKAKASAIAFWVSAAVIAAAIIAPVILAFWNLEAVLTVLRHIGDAATQDLPKEATAAQLTVAAISRLVVITVPIGLYIWLIKLLVRYNTRSLVMMDDAEQRGTMMDTYFHLVEEGKAQPEDRILVLNALFRPAPGQGGDNIEPPNFTDLMGKLHSGN